MRFILVVYKVPDGCCVWLRYLSRSHRNLVDTLQYIIIRNLNRLDEYIQCKSFVVVCRLWTALRTTSGRGHKRGVNSVVVFYRVRSSGGFKKTFGTKIFYTVYIIY